MAGTSGLAEYWATGLRQTAPERNGSARRFQADPLADTQKVVHVRTAGSGDLERLRAMFSRLSQEAIYRRFHTPYQRVPDWALSYLVGDHNANNVVLIAVVENLGTDEGRDEIVGHGMYVRSEDGREAEVALVVEDGWQSTGLGKLLLFNLAERAANQDIETFTCTALGENGRVLALASAVFAEIGSSIKDGSRLIRAPLHSLKPRADGAQLRRCGPVAAGRG